MGEYHFFTVKSELKLIMEMESGLGYLIFTEIFQNFEGIQTSLQFQSENES